MNRSPARSDATRRSSSGDKPCSKTRGSLPHSYPMLNSRREQSSQMLRSTSLNSSRAVTMAARLASGSEYCASVSKLPCQVPSSNCVTCNANSPAASNAATSGAGSLLETRSRSVFRYKILVFMLASHLLGSPVPSSRR